MKIDSNTQAKNIKKRMINNLDKIPEIELSYHSGNYQKNDDYCYWIDRISNRSSKERNKSLVKSRAI